MSEKLITKSFERLLDKGNHRGFITYEELGKSLGKRNSTNENIERAFIILVDEKITQIRKKKILLQMKKKHLIKVMIQLGCTLGRWVVSNYFHVKVKLL
jgi:hypothetical protein